MDSSDTSEVAGAAPAELVSTLFADRFNVARLASDGANTAIFDAVDTENGRLVTLKLVRPQLAASPSFRKRFDETMRAVGAMSHQNVAAVYDWGIARVGDSSTAYVVTELLTGGSMRDMLDRGRRLSPSQALLVVVSIMRIGADSFTVSSPLPSWSSATIDGYGSSTLGLPVSSVSRSGNSLIRSTGTLPGTRRPNKASVSPSTPRPTSTRFRWCSTKRSPASCRSVPTRPLRRCRRGSVD